MPKKAVVDRVENQGGPTPRMVAFLRAINVGGRRVTNADLTEAAVRIGLHNPTTFLASGNLVFDLPTLTNQASCPAPQELSDVLTDQLAIHLGFSSEVFLRTMTEVAHLGGSNPFQLTAAQLKSFTVHVAFLAQPLKAAEQKRLLACNSEYDAFYIDQHEFWWLCRGPKLSDSRVFQDNMLAKAVQQPFTARNQNTLRRLVAKFG